MNLYAIYGDDYECWVTSSSQESAWEIWRHYLGNGGLVPDQNFKIHQFGPKEHLTLNMGVGETLYDLSMSASEWLLRFRNDEIVAETE